MEQEGVKMTDKMKSRTWMLTVYWSLMVPVSIVVQIFVDIELPIGTIVGLAGAITTTYIGKRALQVNAEAKK